MMQLKNIIILSLIQTSFAITLSPVAATNRSPNTIAQTSKYYQRLFAGNQAKATSNQRDQTQFNFITLLQSAANYSLKQIPSSRLQVLPSSPLTNTNTSIAKTANQRLLLARIALAVVDVDRKYKIIMLDNFGETATPIAISSAPITSLAWNNSGNSIAYVSYESGKPVVYIQNIFNARRYIVANFSGSNSSPAFKDNSLLVSLSKDYGTHVYQINLEPYSAKKTATPILNQDSIDTEADYANNNLIYTASKNNKPVIYLKNANSTTQISPGVNNTTGRISVDGSKILYLHGTRGRSELIYYDLRSGKFQKIDSGKIQAASFAPDNKTIAYNKNRQIIIYNLDNNRQVTLANLRFKEILDLRWSK